MAHLIGLRDTDNDLSISLSVHNANLVVFSARFTELKASSPKAKKRSSTTLADLVYAAILCRDFFGSAGIAEAVA